MLPNTPFLHSLHAIKTSISPLFYKSNFAYMIRKASAVLSFRIQHMSMCFALQRFSKYYFHIERLQPIKLFFFINCMTPY